MHMNQTITSVDVDSMKSSITHWTYIVLFCCFEHKRLVISQWRIQDFPEVGAPNPEVGRVCKLNESESVSVFTYTVQS